MKFSKAALSEDYRAALVAPRYDLQDIDCPARSSSGDAGSEGVAVTELPGFRFSTSAYQPDVHFAAHPAFDKRPRSCDRELLAGSLRPSMQLPLDVELSVPSRLRRSANGMLSFDATPPPSIRDAHFAVLALCRLDAPAGRLFLRRRRARVAMSSEAVFFSNRAGAQYRVKILLSQSTAKVEMLAPLTAKVVGARNSIYSRENWRPLRDSNSRPKDF